MFLSCVLILSLTHGIEGRVFCQDSNSLPWTPLGYACPVTCDNVITAIDRLRILDYNGMISEQIEIDKRLALKTETAWQMKGDHFQDLAQEAATSQGCYRVVEVNSTEQPSTRAYDKLKYDLFYDYVVPDYMGDSRTVATTTASPKNKYFEWRRSDDCGISNEECNSVNVDGKQSLLLDKLLRQCKRRSARYEDEFIKKFTEILNKYAYKQFQFTQDMTAMLLDKVLGESTDLNSGVFDINKVLSFLRTAIKRHRTRHRARSTAVVRARHCAGVRVSGCFCRDGFVESAQQCVSLHDCATEHRLGYLPRLTVVY